MKSYQLTEAEADWVGLLGGHRNYVSHFTGIVDRRRSKDKSSYDTNAEGMIGEYAFCKYHNIFLPVTPKPQSGGYDCILEKDGRKFRVDVKTTKNKTGQLIASTKINPDIDIFAMAIFDPVTLTVTFPGWVSASRMYSDEYLTNLGHGPTYAIPQSHLNRWRDDDEGVNGFERPKLMLVAND